MLVACVCSIHGMVTLVLPVVQPGGLLWQPDWSSQTHLERCKTCAWRFFNHFISVVDLTSAIAERTAEGKQLCLVTCHSLASLFSLELATELRSLPEFFRIWVPETNSVYRISGVHTLALYPSSFSSSLIYSFTCLFQLDALHMQQSHNTLSLLTPWHHGVKT